MQPGANLTLTVIGGDRGKPLVFQGNETYFAVFFHGLLNFSMPLDTGSSPMHVTVSERLEAKGIFEVVLATEEGAQTEESVVAGPLVLLMEPVELGWSCLVEVGWSDGLMNGVTVLKGSRHAETFHVDKFVFQKKKALAFFSVYTRQNISHHLISFFFTRAVAGENQGKDVSCLVHPRVSVSAFATASSVKCHIVC